MQNRNPPKRTTSRRMIRISSIGLSFHYGRTYYGSGYNGSGYNLWVWLQWVWRGGKKREREKMYG